MLSTPNSPRTLRQWFLIAILVCFVVAVALFGASNLLGREKKSKLPVSALMDATNEIDIARNTEGSSGSRGR